MDQESGNRRRSSRLAARGVTTPRTDNVVKKIVKTAEKPKRSKRKTTEEAIELPETKKTKTENTESSNKVNRTNNTVDKVLVISLVKSDAVVNSPMDVDSEKNNAMPPSNVEQNDKPVDEQNDKSAVEQIDTQVEQNDKPVEQNEEIVEQNDEPVEQNDIPVEQNDKPVEQIDTPVVELNDKPIIEQNDKPAVEEKTEVPSQDSKEQEVIEKVPVVDEKEKVDPSLKVDEQLPEKSEEPMKIKEPEISEQQNDTAIDEPKKEVAELVASENMNGKGDEKETINPGNETVNNDNGQSLANEVVNKDIVTSNGDKSIIGLETIEPIKVICDDKSPVESEVITVKTVTTPTVDEINTNNDALIVEQVSKELDKPDDSVIDSTSTDENISSVEQSTVVS